MAMAENSSDNNGETTGLLTARQSEIEKELQLSTDFLTKLNEIKQSREVKISDLDLNIGLDRQIAIESLLRNLDEDKYFSLVNGLMEIADEPKMSEEMKKGINNIAEIIMDVGREHLGIDWS